MNKNQKSLKFYYYGKISVIRACNSKKVSNFAFGLQGSDVSMPFFPDNSKIKIPLIITDNEQN